MADGPLPVPTGQTLTGAQARRWTLVLDHLVGALPAGAPSVLVDGAQPHAATVADRLAEALRSIGRPCTRLSDRAPLADEDNWHAARTPDTVALADGARWRAHPPGGDWDVVIWLRTRPGGGGRDDGADIVIDLHHPAWPVLRHVADRLAPPDQWYVSESQAFFAVRAATWDTRFGDDLPAYASAVAAANLPAGGVVVDVGCGTGRALPALRDAVGPDGTVLGLDLTPEMLDAAHGHAARAAATLLLGNVRQLPLADSAVDAVFAAGLLSHLPDAEEALRELARITRPGGRLVLFHPAGRAALAARHGRALRPDEPLSEAPLRHSTARTGWRLTGYDDAAHRFLALATRYGPDTAPPPLD
ncbi:class I SAM-dependent methyltransferase [Plantactinospora sp. CA-290183]|uniref:class I SAM-dependent methyltransferase n=1 Tax=Plantactinospora sp. CA-290183 TaxID=3240006 RepID=UPI003D90987A